MTVGLRVLLLAVLLATIALLVIKMTTNSLTFDLLPPFYLITIATSAGAYAALAPLTRRLQ